MVYVVSNGSLTSIVSDTKELDLLLRAGGDFKVTPCSSLVCALEKVVDLSNMCECDLEEFVSNLSCESKYTLLDVINKDVSADCTPSGVFDEPMPPLVSEVDTSVTMRDSILESLDELKERAEKFNITGVSERLEEFKEQLKSDTSDEEDYYVDNGVYDSLDDEEYLNSLEVEYSVSEVTDTYKLGCEYIELKLIYLLNKYMADVHLPFAIADLYDELDYCSSDEYKHFKDKLEVEKVYYDKLIRHLKKKGLSCKVILNCDFDVSLVEWLDYMLAKEKMSKLDDILNDSDAVDTANNDMSNMFKNCNSVSDVAESFEVLDSDSDSQVTPSNSSGERAKGSKLREMLSARGAK